MPISAPIRVGVPDVVEKRKEGTLNTVVWGCEVQGRRGRAGAPRERRMAIAALTVELCTLGFTTIGLLQTLCGLWVDVLLYRRCCFAFLRATYHFLECHKGDACGVVRTVPGNVIAELLGLSALAPSLDSPLRAQLGRQVVVSDASPTGGAAVRSARCGG